MAAVMLGFRSGNPEMLLNGANPDPDRTAQRPDDVARLWRRTTTRKDVDKSDAQSVATPAPAEGTGHDEAALSPARAHAAETS